MLLAAAVCSLLTSADVSRVQGEPVAEAKPSAREAGDLHVEQCFLRLPTFAKSLSLEVTRGAVRPFWKKTFHGKREARGEEADKEGEEGRETPQRVRGLGDEAFWVGNAQLGGLYVLRRNAMLRLSVGGPETQPQKLKKLKTLARLALKRL